MNLDGCRGGSKPGLTDLKLKDAVSETLHFQTAIVGSGERVSIMARGAYEQDRCFHAMAERIRELEVKSAAGALAEDRRDREDENQSESLHDDPA